MIAVIADDFTGAAELAGIAIRYGLTVELFTDTATESNADVVVLSTDSRSMKRDRALVATVEALKQLLKLKPDWIYKKIDSVLRGYVIDELQLQAKMTGHSKIFIAPANPSLKRTITKGTYYIDGIPIDQTGFKDDPEFPARSAAVNELLGVPVQVLPHTAALPDAGIVVGAAETAADTNAWAAKLDASWLLAGAGDFFTALLGKAYKASGSELYAVRTPYLYVCGTAFEERKKYIQELARTQHCVCYLPQQTDEAWFSRAGDIIRVQNKLVIAIDDTEETALALRLKMAKAAKRLIVENNVKEVFIEGGSTATAFLQAMHFTQLRVVNELTRGVVRMRSDDLCITVKPGSYKLPEEIKNTFTGNTDKYR